jgi:tetratricopeptide (TPR) repeat protein
MVRSDIEKQNFDSAITLLDMLNGVLTSSEIVRLRGETYESWAALLQLKAETTFGEQGEHIAREAESKRRSAGATFAALAGLSSATLEFPDLLWRSAENYRLGKDHRRAIVEYQKYQRVNLVDHRPEVYYRLGEMYLHLDDLVEAADTLEEALKDFPTHHLVPQMRLLLSHVYHEQKEWDKAIALLQLNLVGESTPTSGIYRDSMYELGRISFARRDWDAAMSYLEDTLKVHPDAIQAADASYLLAQTYFIQADNELDELANNPTEEFRQWIESNVQTRRLLGLSLLDKTEQILADRQKAMGLTEAEQLMRRNVLFITCSVMLKMKQYEQVIPKLNAAATIYQDREESLDALVKMAFAMRMIGRDTEAQTTLRRAEVILNQLEKNGTIPDGTNWRNILQGQIRR